MPWRSELLAFFVSSQAGGHVLAVARTSSQRGAGVGPGRPRARPRAHLDGAQQGLRGDAGPERALAADELLLDDGDGHPPGGEALGRVTASGPGAEDDDVELVGWHPGTLEPRGRRSGARYARRVARLVDIGDTCLHVEERGAGALGVIALHGGPGLDHTEFGWWLDPIADDHRLLLVDQRSQGRSQPAPPGTWTVERMAADVTALAAALQLERYVVLGHSFGAFVALSHLVGPADPAHAGTVVSCGVPSERWLAGVEEELARFEPEDLRAQVQASWAREAEVRTPQDVAAVLADQLPFHFADPRDPRIGDLRDAMAPAAYAPDVLRAAATGAIGVPDVEAAMRDVRTPGPRAGRGARPHLPAGRLRGDRRRGAGRAPGGPRPLGPHALRRAARRVRRGGARLRRRPAPGLGRAARALAPGQHGLGRLLGGAQLLLDQREPVGPERRGPSGRARPARPGPPGCASRRRPAARGSAGTKASPSWR